MYICIYIHINTYTSIFDRLQNIGLFSGTLQQERGSFFAVKKRFVFAVKKRLFLAAKKRLFEHTWYFSKHAFPNIHTGCSWHTWTLYVMLW